MADREPSRRPEEGVFVYEWNGAESVCEAIIRAVSAVSGLNQYPRRERTGAPLGSTLCSQQWTRMRWTNW